MLMHIQFMNRKVHFKEKGMDKLLIIAGPCVIESEENAMLIAEKMKQIVARLGV